MIRIILQQRELDFKKRGHSAKERLRHVGMIRSTSMLVDYIIDCTLRTRGPQASLRPHEFTHVI